MRFALVVSIVFLQSTLALAGATQKDLDYAVSKSNWDEAVEMSHEILFSSPKSAEAKIKGAYALFQKGYSNSALIMLRTLTQKDWQSLPQGQDRLVEVVSLFQKKVPLNFFPWQMDQINVKDATSYMSDELRYLKGRAAYEHGQNSEAETLLESVSKNSRFFAAAHYLLGSMAAGKHDYVNAVTQLSKVFDPTVLDQSSEFWKDVGAQMTSHWGSNFKVMLDTDLLEKNAQVAELSVLALARVAYATKDFETALKRYSDISVKSPLHGRAVLEKIWTLWALNRHADAQKVAAELAVDGSSFSTVEAHVLRALVLADSSLSDEARAEIQNFDRIFTKTKLDLQEYQQRSLSQLLPPFLQFDLEQDSQYLALKGHQKSLDEEIKAVKLEDQKLFPVYSDLLSELNLWKTKSLSSAEEITRDHVTKRITDLDRLNIQSKLILAETYLEDREKLKLKAKNTKITDEKMQRAHDEELIALLTKAIDVVEEPYNKMQWHHSKIQFRQAELFWELGTAKLILGQASGNFKLMTDEGTRAREKAQSMIDDLALQGASLSNFAGVLFFKGFAELELDHTAGAVKTFRLYLQKFPTHEHAADTYRILADLSFDENKFTDAEKDYKKILEFPESPLVGYALYKLGWCAYNLKNFGRALLALEKAYVWTEESNQNQLIGLKKESRHYLISIYAEVGDANKATEYFKRFSSVGGVDWLVELTKEYENNGQFEKAQNIYRNLIIMDANSSDNMTYMAGIIQSAYKLQRWDLVTSTLKELIAHFGQKLSVSQADTSPEYAVEKIVREVVGAHQTDFRRSSNPEIIKRIVSIDELYLTQFKSWSFSQDILYRHAQYLLEKSMVIDAEKSFKQHWLQFQDTLKEPLKEEALRNLIHTLGTLEEKHTLKELSAEANDILSYAPQYRTLYPSTKYLRPILYLYSTTLLKYGRTDEGISLSQKLYDENPTDEIGSASFKNLSKTYYGLKDWQRTFIWANTLGAASEKNKTYAAEIQTIRQESYFLWAENTKDDVESAGLFLKAVDDPQMKTLWKKSLYNAFVRFNKVGKKYEALQTASRMEKLFPGEDSVVQIAGLRAAIYQEAGDYASALPYLEQFLRSSDAAKTSPSSVAQAQLNAALIAEALDQKEKAKDYYNRFLHNPSVVKKEDAERGLSRLLASVNAPIGNFPEWAKLTKEKASFINKPLVAQQDLVAELKTGALRLQKLTEQFISAANSPKTPAYYAVESYCALPFLYASYSQAVRALGVKDKDLQTELEKVASPIDAKVDDFAKGCIDGALSTETGGPLYEEVLKQWGWQKDAKLNLLVSQITVQLEKNGPWLEPLDIKTSESEMINANLKSEALTQAPDSWLKLARLRFQSGHLGLSRLTYMDALSREPASGALLNGFACAEQKLEKVQEAVSGLFKHAGTSGSGYAWINEGLIQLRAHRLPLAKEAFQKALLTAAFDSAPKLKQDVKELTGP